jgi:hypothetical protein
MGKKRLPGTTLAIITVIGYYIGPFVIEILILLLEDMLEDMLEDTPPSTPGSGADPAPSADPKSPAAPVADNTAAKGEGDAPTTDLGLASRIVGGVASFAVGTIIGTVIWLIFLAIRFVFRSLQRR